MRVKDNTVGEILDLISEIIIKHIENNKKHNKEFKIEEK